MRGERYLGELVQAEDLFAVVGAVATLIHQLLELQGDLVAGERQHRKRRQAADGGSCRRAGDVRTSELAEVRSQFVRLLRPNGSFVS